MLTNDEARVAAAMTRQSQLAVRQIRREHMIAALRAAAERRRPPVERCVSCHAPFTPEHPFEWYCPACEGSRR